MIKRLTLLRAYKKEATLGRILNEDGATICETIERPRFYYDFENVRDDKSTPNINESCCILEGIYQVDWTFSPRFQRHTFELIDVPGRTGIRIHRANKVDQLEGCIAPVTEIIDMNKDEDGRIPFGERWFGASSKKAEDALIKEIGQNNSFELVIVSNESLCSI
jgi:hypothetical protein